MSPEAPGTPSRGRILAALRSQDVPRLFRYFAGLLTLGGAGMFLLERDTNPQFRSFEDGVWWALVTLTTVGYGDKVPMTHGGRLLASVVAVLGIGLLGIVTGKIAGALVERRIKEGKGLTDARNLKGHLVILGHKADLGLLLKDLLQAHPGLTAGRLVLVNQAGEMANDSVRADFPGVVYIHGDIIDPAMLARASLTAAAKVLVLADEGEGRSDQERDARTVMAVLNIKSYAPEVYTCAEVLDRKHVEHLRLARCDEIILSREYGRFMLVNAAVSSGISEVLHDLLQTAGAGTRMSTRAVPEPLVGRPVSELAALLKDEGVLLIGLLENTGQPLAVKREALRAAQKTENVATLLDNLRAVKDMVPNKPVLEPSRLLPRSRAGHGHRDRGSRRLHPLRGGEVSAPESRRADVRAALLACTLFEKVAADEAALSALTRICGLVSLSAGEVVFSEGSQGDALFVIRTGRVRTEKHTSEHDPYTVRFFDQGDFFGELSLLEDVPRSATVVAETDGEFLVLSRDVFRGWCDAYPTSGLEVTRQVAQRLAERLRRVSEDVVTLFSALVNEIEQRL